jgi:Fe-S-cluster-containing dehydrogenase component
MAEQPGEMPWGKEVYPPPKGPGFIFPDDLKCVGCGLCAEACSMQHYGLLNKDYARIYVRKFLLPISKAVVVTCCQCQQEERECQKACPVSPPAIFFDDKTQHMRVDKERCTGCLACQAACGTEAIRVNPELGETPFVCDLCDVDNSGRRDPQCVKACPTSAIQFQNKEDRGRSLRDSLRKGSGEKADLIAKRLYPLTRDSVTFPPLEPKSGTQTRRTV